MLKKIASAATSALLIAVLVAHAAMAQEVLPVLKSNSKTVDVQDGSRLHQGVWFVDTASPLDVYTADRTTRGKRITFITDVESMSFDVQPGRTYDFVILLNGKDACRTRISTMTQGFLRVGTETAAGPATFPITIVRGKPHLQGKVNDSESLDFIFDTGADTNVLYPSAMKRGAKLAFDGTAHNAGTGGATTRQTASDNRLEVGGLLWEHEPFLFVEKQADSADGIVGYPVFLDKVLEIDYDRMVMVVHDALPEHSAGFARTAMPFFGSLTAVEAVLVHGEHTATGPFILDTGGTGAMNVNQAFAKAHGLHGSLERLGTSTSRGVGGGAVRNEVVMLPELRIAGIALRDVPTHVELPCEANSAPPGGTLNMEVLGRFNTLLDYSRNQAYFRPNSHFSAPFKRRLPLSTRLAIAGIAVTSMASLAGLGALLARRRRRGSTRSRCGSPPRDPGSSRRETKAGVSGDRELPGGARCLFARHPPLR
jgi:hypothetical protein